MEHSKFQSNGTDTIESTTVVANIPASMLYEHSMRMVDSMVKYKEMIMMYTCAMKEIKTKFEVMDTDCKIRNRRNPISSIHTRIKSTASIMEKMNRLNVPFQC